MAGETVRNQYDEQNEQVILERLLDEVPDDVDKRQGSIVYDMLSPVSIEAAFLYADLANVLDFGFADTTYGEFLDRRANEVGLTRKPATFANGTVTFTGVPGITVPSGVKVSTINDEPIIFITEDEVTLNDSGLGTVGVIAVEAGARGNVGIGRIKKLVNYVSGVDYVTNAENFDGGSDIESDEELLERYLIRMRKPSTSGNKYQYEQWALSIPGIGGAKVFPLWNGNGTVKVTLIDTEMTPPDELITEEARAFIENERPIGATVTVVPASAVDININVKLALEPNSTIEQAIEDIETTTKEYLKTLAYKDPVVRYTQIAANILDSPYVLDYFDLTVNEGTGNIYIPDGDVAVAGAVIADVSE